MNNNQHPSFIRMQRIAEELGSHATTPRGVLRFLRDHRRPRPTALTQWLHVERDEWREQQAARRADPEAKRARDDRQFRRRYLAQLRRREQRALSFDATTLDGVIQRIDTRQQRQAELAEVARLRSIVAGKQATPADLPKVLALPHVALVSIDERTARRLGADLNMRGKNATLDPTARASYGHHEEAYTIWDRKGRPRGVRAEHHNYVRSLALIVTPQRLDAVFHRTQVVRVLPEGYEWSIDDNGLRVVDVNSRRDDYHPDAEELLREDAAEHIIARINANRERRREMAAKLAVEQAAVRGVYVCLADSVRAGNCRVGTLEFGKRHHLDPSRHYSAPDLLALANGDASRVRLAVTAARLRHEREMAAGVCQLADHQ